MPGRRRLVESVAGCLLLTAAVVLAYGPGFVNYDTMYALSWGAELAEGGSPSYDVVLPPTPHPLTNLTGMLLAPFGAGAYDGAWVLGVLGLAALAWTAYRLGELLAGWMAGAVAAVLVLTRNPILYWGSQSFLDIPFTALVLGAVLVEARSPGRRPRSVLTLLLFAGLLRPEAWVLAGGYVVYIVWRTRARPAPTTVLLAVAAPVVWLAMDLVTTGQPLYSFTLTTDLTRSGGKVVGPIEVLVDLPRTVAQTMGPGVALGAVLGAIVSVRRWPGVAVPFLVGTLAATGMTAAVILAGTPLNVRYLFVAPVAGCVLCAVALRQVLEPSRTARLIGLVAIAAVLVGGVLDVGRLRRGSDDLARGRQVMDDLRGLVSTDAASRCPRLVVPSRVAPWVSIEKGRPAQDFQPTRGVAGAAVVAPTDDPYASAVAVRNGDSLPGGAWRRLPPVAANRSWTVRLVCADSSAAVPPVANGG